MNLSNYLAALRLVDVEKYRRIVTRAVRRARGNMREAAASLGCGYSTLKKWLRDDPVLAKVARRGPGRPSKCAGA